MNTIMNQHLFRHRETKSAGFNNLCTIIHKLADEGLYAGEVVQGKRLLGTFRLTCNGKTEQSQVNINLSAFDALFRANVRGLPETNNYFVGKDGYVVLHASGHHSELYVKLSKLEKEKATPKFDSRRLGPHDMVALRLWQPGSYAVSNEPGGQKATLIVRDEDNGRYPDLTKLEPVRVTLSGKGFEPARIETWPAQALVVTIE
ncbi:MAG TPA: hypothetical protein VNI35_01470, partial [Nitrospira sp.]|nr:hypothetical protein [Nitrospira sp.]